MSGEWFFEWKFFSPSLRYLFIGEFADLQLILLRLPQITSSACGVVSFLLYAHIKCILVHSKSLHLFLGAKCNEKIKGGKQFLIFNC